MGSLDAVDIRKEPLLLGPAPARDRWLAVDKVQHVTFSFLWTLGSQYVLTNKAGWSERRALPWSAGGSVSIGVSKEVLDASDPLNTFSWRDLTANVVGIALAAGLILL